MSLKDIPSTFNPDSEEDIRFLIAQYFTEIGFQADEISFEDQFTIRLGHKEIDIPRSKKSSSATSGGRSDILLTRNGKSLAIVETKAPDHQLTNEDAEQAISYARLLREIAPFAIVTNGKHTLIYDTYSPDLRPLNSVRDSSSYPGNVKAPSISDDLRFQAARTLIGMSEETLRIFSRKQVIQNISEIKGAASENKFYVDELYVNRHHLAATFDEWLKFQHPCFAIVGHSGIGKTNFMCATAELASESGIVLFYSASKLLTGGLLATIRNDFVWEFHRNQDSAYIVDRLDEIAKIHNLKVLIFLDGIDEFNGVREHLRNEIIDFTNRLRNRQVRLCISCKTFDWADFVIERGQSFNGLASNVYPYLRNELEAPSRPNALNVGYVLQEFNNAELEQAIAKYRKAFKFSGNIGGQARQECQMPLMLRLVAEAFSGGNLQIPEDLSTKSIFDLYWDRFFANLRRGLRPPTEKILALVAELMIATDKRSVNPEYIWDQLGQDSSFAQAYDELLRYGILRSSGTDTDVQHITFAFEKLRSYTYTVKARRWHSKATSVAVLDIQDCVKYALGLEAVEFYLTQIDRGETELLTKLAGIDLRLFLDLLINLKLQRPIFDVSSQGDRGNIVIRCLEQYLYTYRNLVDKHFNKLRSRLAPYSEGQIGLWASIGPSVFYQFRTVTKAYPQPIVFIEQSQAGIVFQRQLPTALIEDLRPGGTIHIGLGNLEDQLPQRVAWEQLEQQIADMINKGLLNESSCVELIQERIHDILIYEPSVWLEGESNPMVRYYQLFGYEEIHQLNGLQIEQLIDTTDGFLETFGHQFQYKKSSEWTPAERGYFNKYRELRRLKYWLHLLEPSKQTLTKPFITRERVFEYIDQRDFNPLVKVLKEILPVIVTSARTMIRENFGDLAIEFAIVKHENSTVVVELSATDFGHILQATYLVLPSVTNQGDEPYVYMADIEHSLASLPSKKSTLRGQSIHYGAKYGVINFAGEVNGQYIEDPNAIKYVTRFPTAMTIGDQVYQIIAAEVEEVFSSGQLGWMSSYSRYSSSHELDQLITSTFMNWKSSQLKQELQSPNPNNGYSYCLSLGHSRGTAIKAKLTTNQITFEPPVEVSRENSQVIIHRFRTAGFTVESSKSDDIETITAIVPGFEFSHYDFITHSL